MAKKFYVTIIADSGRRCYLADNGMLTNNRKYAKKLETRQAAEEFQAKMRRIFGSARHLISILEV